MRRALLVANEDVLDLVLFEQLVIDEQDGAPGITENVFHALRLEALDNDLCARQFHADSIPE